MAKQYGLILPDKGPKKPAPIFSASKNVFGDDSDSDDEGKPSKPVVTAGERLKRQAQVLQNKVLEEDPTVYQYDELYDDIEDQRKKAKMSVQKEEKKPRYIEKLLVAADKRKKENERRVERQVQKEREEEGNKFADKESFVTSAYKKKLEEMRLEDEREKREKYLEEIGDVTKQADLGGFYRHLYEQKLQPEKIKAREEKYGDGSKPVVKKEKADAESEQEEMDQSDVRKNKDESKGKRTYRKRTHSESAGKENDSESDGEVNRKNLLADKEQRVHLQSNIDADSDFSIDESSSSDDEDEGEAKKSKTERKENVDKKSTKGMETKDANTADKKESTPTKDKKDSSTVSDDDNFKKPEVKPVTIATKKDLDKEKEKVTIEEVKPKIDIWKKRTVGEVFEQALQRYYERKAARGT